MLMDWITRNAMRIGIALVAVVLLLGFLQLRSCQRANERAAQSRVDRGQGEAFKGSAGEAVNAITGVAGNEAAGVELGRRNEKEIRNAEGANDRVNPHVRDAGIASLCRRSAARNDPRCRVQPAPAN